MDTTIYRHRQVSSEPARGDSGLPEQREALVLEDEDEVADTLEQLLHLQGFQVTRVPDGAAGLRALLGKDFDLILCDMIMPNLSGEMFYLAVRRTRPRLCDRFLFTTGQRSDPKIEAFIRLVNGLILWKPFDLEELREATSTILGRRRAGRKRPRAC